jgi:RNA polymerase sigma-70 factor (ECF subfamily)
VAQVAATGVLVPGLAGQTVAVDDLTALALAAQAGDRTALEQLVRRTQADVWRLSAHLVDRGSADDLTQDTFARAIGSLHRYRAEAPIKVWLLSITRRVCADAIRSTVRRRNLFARLPRPMAGEPAATGHSDLDALVDDLDPDRRAAFVLTQVLGLSYQEAADVCSCPVGTIRSRVARARDDLTTAMRAGGADGDAAAEA